MLRTPPCSVPDRAARGRSTKFFLILVGILVALAGCGGTTEARSNPDLEPGSGNLGSGDAPPANTAEGGPAPEPAATGGSGFACATSEARREIETLLPRLYLSGWTLTERAEAVQLGSEPDVAERLATGRERARAVPPVSSTKVKRITCIDDGSATLTIELHREDLTETRGGSAMLIDGSWRITLYAFCRWNTRAPCREVPGLEERAVAALSPALRSAWDL